MFGHGINKLFRAPVRLCLWMVFTLLNFSNRYSGAKLFIVLNIKDFRANVSNDQTNSKNRGKPQKIDFAQTL